jgi:hypothetical protein
MYIFVSFSEKGSLGFSVLCRSWLLALIISNRFAMRLLSDRFQFHIFAGFPEAGATIAQLLKYAENL